MIKLEKSDPPKFLDSKKRLELTALYIDSLEAKKEIPVWRDAGGEIKSALLKESHNKCAYCECSVERKGAGVDIEHHLPKKKNPNLVVAWENLLPSCRRCNTKKGTKTGVLNPYADDPKEHFSFHEYRFYGTSNLGINTILILNLNDRKKLVNPRFEVGDLINARLYTIENERNLLVVKNLISDILDECQPESEFSATATTTLFNNPLYFELIDKLKTACEWDDDLDELHNRALRLKLNSR